MAGSGWGGQSGCKRRIEVFVKIGVGEGSGLGGQGGCDRRIEKFLGNFTKKKFRGGGRFWGGGGSGWM